MNIQKAKFKFKLLLAAVVISAFFGGSARGAFEYAGRTAREEGMGGAYVALADDSGSVFHNPAGLAALHIPQLLTGYSGLFLGLDEGEISNNIISAGYPIKKKFISGLGFGWSRLTAGDLYTEDSLILGYSVRLMDNLSAGAGLKMLSVGYGEDDYTRKNPVFDSGYGTTDYSADLGLLYRKGNYSLGAAVSDLNSPDVGLKYRNEIPMTVKLGASIPSPIGSLSFQGEYRDEDMTFAAGGERFLFSRYFVVRGGIRVGSRNYRTASLGLSYGDSWYKVDYAFVYPLSGVSNTMGTHKLNLNFYFGKRVVPAVDVPAVAPMRPRITDDPAVPVISVADIQRSREQTEEAQELLDQNNFKAALEALEEARDIWEGNREAERLMEQVEPIADIFERVDPVGHKGTLISQAISAYFDDEGTTALNSARYASQRWPGDRDVQQLRSMVERKFSTLASRERLIPGLTVVEQKLQEVLEAIYDKRWVGAITLCEEILELEPQNALAMKRMGSAYYGMGNRAKAEEVWREALEITPGDRELQEYLGLREPRREIDSSLRREFDNAVNYYNTLVEAGADVNSRITVLERIISTYRDRGVDIRALEEELNRLQRR